MSISKKDISILLLCGGKGERLKPLTDKVPKPLIEIKGQPILDYQIQYFKKFGFRNFVVATGYRAEAFESYFEQKDFGVDVKLVDSGDVDIIQRIKDARKHISNDFILCYGDTLANVNLPGLTDFHSLHPGTISMTSYQLKSPFGIIEIDDSGLVGAFKEKPILDYWINIGFMYFDNQVLGELDRHDSFVEFLDRKRKDSSLYSYKHKGVHITVNTMKELYEAENDIGLFSSMVGD